MQIISSKDNELVKHIKKLKDKKYRDESNEYIIEGVKLIEEAVKEKAKIKKEKGEHTNEKEIFSSCPCSNNGNRFSWMWKFII